MNKKKSGVLTHYWASPVGLLSLTAQGAALTRAILHPGGAQEPKEAGAEPDGLFQRAIQQLTEYFAGRRRKFRLPLAPAGTEFQRRVWAALQDIPYGQTISYGDLAARVGSPLAFRAAGQACRHNPLVIFVPCHRVVGRDGKLTGFASGLAIKELLLRLEEAAPGPVGRLPCRAGPPLL